MVFVYSFDVRPLPGPPWNLAGYNETYHLLPGRTPIGVYMGKGWDVGPESV